MFISYTETKKFGDSPDAKAEAKDLYAKLEAQGYKPWINENGLKHGDVLAKIFWVIKQCDVIIPIMTGSYATSLLCLRELYYAATLQKDPKPKTIIPMLLESEDVIKHENAGKWLWSIGTVQKYFGPTEKEKVDMIESLKDKVFSILSTRTHKLQSVIILIEGYW